MEDEAIERARKYFGGRIEEVDLCRGGCGKNLAGTGRFFHCEECHEEEVNDDDEDDEECWECGEVLPEDEKWICETCMEKDSESPTECSECGDELDDADIWMCESCIEASQNETVRDYRCTSCGEMFEGTRNDIPSCDSCGVVSDRTVDDTGLSEVQIYLIETGGYVKIGISNDPERRRHRIQTSTPLPVEIITTIESKEPETVERIFHRKFAEYQTSTGKEWFELPDEICGILKNVDIITTEEAETKF